MAHRRCGMRKWRHVVHLIDMSAALCELCNTSGYPVATSNNDD